MRIRLASAAGVLVLALAAPAAAQDGDRGHGGDKHGVLQGIGAVTSASDAHPLFGGALGGRIGWVELTGEFGHMNDVAPKDLTSFLTVIQSAAGVGQEIAVVRVPAYYGLFNARLVPPSGIVRPVIALGAGAARLEPQLRAGTITVTLPGIFTPERTTVPMIAAGGGVRVGLGPALNVDVGYRYMRIYSNYKFDTNFNNDRILTNVGTFYAALGVRF